MKVTLLLFFLCIGMHPFFAAGQNRNEAEILSVRDGKPYLITEYAKLLETRKDIPVSEVAKRQDLFKEFSVADLPLDPSGSKDYWFMFTVQSATSPLFLSLPNLYYSKIELYKLGGNGAVLISKGGLDTPANEKYLKYPSELFQVTGDRSKPTTYLFRLNRILYRTFAARIFTTKTFIDFQQKNFIGEGILFGLIFGVVIYHLLIYFNIREKEYLVLSIYLFLLTLFLATISGLFYGTFEFENPKWNYIVLNGIAPIVSIFSFWFSYIFLSFSKDTHPRITKVYWIFQMIFLASLIFSVFSVPYLERTNNFVAPLSAGFLLFIATYRYREGFKPALIYLAAYIPAILSVFVLTLYNLGFLEYSWLVQNSLLIGIVLQAIFFSQAIAIKLRLLKEQQQTLLKEENVRLESMVQARTVDLQQSLTKLKSTQEQLIQQEKLASLGELTAGIAHEIQNPLNFVNNYAEVNLELVEELREEFRRGNPEEVETLITDLADNETKIHHHGQRADAIVRGMLLHSRIRSGTKEPTDLNALADEYLRLAYHGLRAKDNEFQAEFITDFDPQLPLVDVIPQDMGRVLLNIINNAFQACAERSRGLSTSFKLAVATESFKLAAAAGGYKPQVSIVTKRLPDGVEVRISDNGNGIPEEVKDKIFQPFFTTKPTGQGTGLGLSLSYDIVTKGHGGVLEVESAVGEGSVFVIVIPVVE